MTKTANIRLQLEVNGLVVAVAGVESFGVMSAIIDWRKLDPAKFNTERTPHHTPESFSREEIRVNLGGLDSRFNECKRHLTWHHQDLKAGDVVTIRVLGAGDFDEAP